MPGTFDQSTVRATELGRGVLPIRGAPLNSCPQVELRRFTKLTVRERTFTDAAFALASRLALPGLGALDAAYWTPLSDPLPGQILAAIADRAAAGAPAPRQREERTRLVPEPGAKPVERIERGPVARVA